MPGSLVVGPAWIGDMVMAHTLVQKIHTSASGQPIEMLAPPATAAIAERMAEVSTVHVFDTRHGELGLGKRYRMGRALAVKGFSRSYVLPNSWKSALVPFFARIPQRSGWLGEARYGLLNDTAALPPERLPLMIERFMALCDIKAPLSGPYPQPRLSVDADHQAELLQQHGLTGSGLVATGPAGEGLASKEHGRQAVAFCPGAEFGQAKRWPAEHFAQVGAQAIAAGCELWLLGGPSDREVCTAIAQQINDLATTKNSNALVRNLAGKTSLPDVVDLLAAASAVVCNDSGLMHVACAVNTPVIALYGSTSPGFTPPLHPAAQALSLVDLDNGVNKLPCQPCFQRTCRYGHGDCLGKLEPLEVIRGLTALGVLDSAS